MTKTLTPEEKEAKKKAVAEKAAAAAAARKEAEAKGAEQAAKKEAEESAIREAKEKAEAEPKPADEKASRLQAIGLQILEDYPNEQAVYMTANGFGFFKFSEAQNHAETLSDKEVLTINR